MARPSEYGHGHVRGRPRRRAGRPASIAASRRIPWTASDAPRAERRRLTHVDRGGRPRMVDVSAKPPTARRAVAEAEVAVSPETLSLVIDGGGAKGDVLTVAELAGVMGGKRTAELIPLCHPLPLTDLVVSVTPGPRRRGAADPGRGRHDRSDGRRDGGDDRRVGRGPHGLRHGQGRGARRRDPRRCAWCRRPAARAASGTAPPRRGRCRRPPRGPAIASRAGSASAGGRLDRRSRREPGSAA